jgi:hypothetical protein
MPSSSCFAPVATRRSTVLRRSMLDSLCGPSQGTGHNVDDHVWVVTGGALGLMIDTRIHERAALTNVLGQCLVRDRPVVGQCRASSRRAPMAGRSSR